MPSLPSLDLINFERVCLTPLVRGWWSTIPAVPGWYAIETNTPIDVLDALVRVVDKPKHYDFSVRAAATAFMRECGEIIQPSSAGESYVMYSGQADQLRKRAFEHSHGNGGTGCLGLSGYPILGDYKWEFLFRTCAAQVPGAQGNKLVRTVLEQRWRAEHGWPLLCLT